MKGTNPAKINLKNIKRFIQGWFRYIIYAIPTGDLQFLSEHKKEQFRYRLQVMDQECLKNGECKICGCQTPQLQMSDESCEGNCYPPMMSKEDWKKFKKENGIII